MIFFVDEVPSITINVIDGSHSYIDCNEGNYCQNLGGLESGVYVG